MVVLLLVLLSVVVPSALASQQPVTVRAATAEREAIWREIVYAARLRPRSTVDQRAPATGIIDRIDVQAGQMVAPGQLLMTVRRNVPTDSFRPIPVESFHNGVVADVLVTPGQEVRDGDAIIRIADTSSLIAELMISDKDIDRIRTGAAVTAMDSARDLTLSGRVTRTALIPDFRTGLFPVEVTVNAGRGAFVGQFLRFSFRTDETTAVLVAREHLELRGGRYHLFVVNGETVTMRPVTLGPEYGTRVVITEGLNPGERYVISADRRLQDGMPVTIGAAGGPGGRPGGGRP